MAVSIIEAQREILLSTIRQITRGDWKVLVLDHDSKRLIDNVLDQDTILNENVTNIEQITDRRPNNRDVDAIYVLTPHPHIVDCVMADLDKRKYRSAYLVWTSLLHPTLRDRIDKSQSARSQIRLFKVLNVEFFPRESHLITFRDPWSFPILYHPSCSSLIRQHLEDTAQKIVGVCVSLGEYPVIRYYRPPQTATHEAHILCSHLARFVQDELDLYAKFHDDFPPKTSRPRGALYIVDRSMDLCAPIVHEFTYQAMAHDLLPIKEGDKITYRTLVNEGQPDAEEKDVEITEKDKIWIENRHRHMKDTIEKLMSDFQKFIRENPNFTKSGDAASLNAIKDMLAGLPQFQELKEAYALHLSMAQESMNRFQQYKLPDLASIEQILATGLDEEYKKPKGLADQVIRMLDEEGIRAPDRLRLLMLYIIFKDGLLPADTQKLLQHAQLPGQDGEVIRNMELLGARTSRGLRDPRPKPGLLFPRKPVPVNLQDEYSLSRYETVLQNMLEAHGSNTLDATMFPYTKPPLDIGDDPTMAANPAATAASLRSRTQPTWARNNRAGNSSAASETRQRVIVFMAGGATYSESRACALVGRGASSSPAAGYQQQQQREIYLVSSHMLTPLLFVRQLADLSADRRRLNIPADMPKPQAPKHLFEPDPQPKPVAPPAQQQQFSAKPQLPPPTQAMGQMNINSAGPSANSSAKLTKEPAGEKEKKRKGLLGFGKSRS